METTMVVLRLFHIVAGVYWVGASAFPAFVLEPRLHALGPQYQGPVLRAVGRVAGPSLMIASIVTIAFGIGLTFKLRASALDDFFVTGSGWAILIGFITSMVAFALGARTGMIVAKLERLMENVGDGPPPPEVAAQAQNLMSTISRLSRVDAVLVVIALGAMASARFV